VSTHVIEVGPNAIRELCCGADMVGHDEMVRAAFDSIDDRVALVDLHPVTVDSLWRTVLGSLGCGSPERMIVVHPSWWAPTRIDVVRGAAQVLAGEVVMRPRSWLLTQASPLESRHTTVVVEIADQFVVIIGATVVAETRRREPQCVVEAVVRSILDMTSDATVEVVIDAPTTVGGADALAAMIAEGLRTSGGIGAAQVDDVRLKKVAAEVIQGDDSSCASHYTEAMGRDHRRRWRLALVVLLTVTVLGTFGALASARRGAPAGGGVPTTFLVEGRVVLEVPAQWPTQRVVAGPGSARVQLTSPSDPEMALHVTQSRVAIEALSATAEFLKQAIDAEPTGVFVDFNPAGNGAGRPAVTYREVRSGHDIRWTVLVDKAVRISIGCQSRHGYEDAMRQVCELAVRSARALS
jgi:type VII secretion-associated protein (TIGR03931 family)